MLPQIKVKYPDGTAAKTETGVYYLKNNLSYELPTPRIVNSWSFAFIVPSTDFAISEYKKVGKLGFRDGSLVKSMSDRSLYVVSGSTLRKIVNPDWLMIMGLTEKDFVKVADSELFQKRGEDLG